MTVSKIKQIPDGFIEKADNYVLIPMDTMKGIPLGGKIMYNMVVKDQMTVDNIIFTFGFAQKVCIITVSYTAKEVQEMIANAKRLAGKLIDVGGNLN